MFAVKERVMKHISPTDITQYVRFEKCERYLYFKLHGDKVEGRPIFADDVMPEPIPPLLTLMGEIFERRVEASIRHPMRNLSAIPKQEGAAVLLAEIRALPAGGVVFLFQVGLTVEVDGWMMTGAIDILRLHRDRRGRLKVLVVDIKSSGSVKVEYRLQVAFYQAMLERLFHDNGVDYVSITTSILYRGQRDYTEVKDATQLRLLKRHRRAALRMIGFADAFLEVIRDSGLYRQEIEDMVTSRDSTAHRLLQSNLADLPFCLTYKCDTCLYNNYCMKWSAEREDLALLPFLNINDRKSLISAGIRNISQLGRLKRLTSDGSLEVEPGCEEKVRELSRMWGMGARLDELIHRARAWIRRRDPSIEALSWIPDKGYSSLPHSDAQLNPNLVQIYIDAQHDYHHGRVFMLGALVVAHAGGVPVRRRLIVELTDGPPDTAEKERRLYVRWVNKVLRTIVELAEPDAKGEKNAPIHVVFYDQWEQSLLLDGLARNFSGVLGATPLYDFMTQIAAYDSPVASFLDEEIRKFTNYPMVCQSLQAVATYLGYDWNAERDYTSIFYYRFFDFVGKFTQATGEVEWYNARSRFSSLIPLEYVYAAWNCLPETDNALLNRFKGVRVEDLVGFEGSRLGAIEHIARRLKTNRYSAKQSFRLPSLEHFEDKARNFAEALREFMVIERHVELADWKRIRHFEPERRVLMGEALLTSYHAEDQNPEVARRLQENLLKHRERQRLLNLRRQLDPEARLTDEENQATKWSNVKLNVRLRLTDRGLDCTLEEMMLLNNLEEGDRVVVYSRYTVDERLPVEERMPFTPTPRQMLYGPRAELNRIVLERDGERVVSGHVELTICSNQNSAGEYCFPSIEKPFEDGQVYTLDIDPNSIYGYWCAKTVDKLCEAEANGEGSLNVLYSRITSDTQRKVFWSDKAQRAQERFMRGLEAFVQAGLLHDFEPAKRAYISGHGGDALLLVQGPPGTGKSYSTAFAVLARMQGAMSDGRDYRVTLSCKTHAATDVLVKNLRKALDVLHSLRLQAPDLFAEYFDARLLDTPLFRVYGHEELGDGITMLNKSETAANIFKQLLAVRWAVVAATPGAIYKLIDGKSSKQKRYVLLGYYFTDCLVLDEASQMNLPEACMAALGLRPEGHLIVVGDHRQMPPIVHHDWDSEPRRTFQEYQSFRSLFWILQAMGVPMIKFTKSFRLHGTMAKFLRDEIYIQDGINYYSERRYLLDAAEYDDSFVGAVLSSDYPLVVVVHDEASSQTQNLYELNLIKPVLESLSSYHGLNAESGLGVVVPHRLQRAVMRRDISCLVQHEQGKTISAVDTVERFQGDERDVIVVSATESDPQFVQACSRFLLDPRRLTVALSRARKKMVLVASRTIFQMFESDEETFRNLCMWKNLLRRTCKETLWEGERGGCWVQVRGAKV